MFCTRKCLAESRRKSSQQFICKECKQPFNRLKSEGRNDTYTFCSKTCSITHSNKERGSKKSLTLKELRDSCANTYQYHSKIRYMSRKVYKESDRPQWCYVCRYSIHVDICHIKSVSSFGPNATLAEVNDLDNLVALCKTHHWELDHGYLTLTPSYDKLVAAGGRSESQRVS